MQSSDSSTFSPSLAKKSLLALISLALALGAGELWLRTRSPVELGFEYRDGLFDRALPFERDGRSNSLGFHDVETRPKAPGTYRVLLLGDSYVASRSVSIPQSLGRRLEFHLQSHPESHREDQSGRDFDVVIVAEEAWGQRQQLAALRSLGERLQPDLVVTLFLSLNDVRNNDPALDAKGKEQIRRMRHFRPGWWRFHKTDVPFFWIEGSVLNQVLSHRLAIRGASRRHREIPIDYFVYAEPPSPEWRTAWRATGRLLLETRRLAGSLGAAYALVSASTPQGVLGSTEGLEALLASYPAMSEYTWDLDRPDRELARFANENGVPFLVLEPLFRRLTLEEGTELHWKLDGHWNVEGNDRAAAEIAELVRAVALGEPES